MYSMVVMAALTTGTNAPDCGLLRCRFGCATQATSCYGCYGCRGCQGGAGYYGCNGCYGGGYTSGCYGCHGCYGCGGYYGGSPYYPSQAMPPADRSDSPAPPKDEKDKKQESQADKAKLILDVPVDAKLYIDDQLMKTTSNKRAFNTPTLERGQTYYYVVRVEVVRDGKTLEQTKRVLVRGGEQVKASFNDMKPSPAFIAQSDSNR